MKAGWVLAIVVAIHVIGIGSLLVIQGCGTPRMSSSASRAVEEPKLPPGEAVETSKPAPPFDKSVLDMPPAPPTPANKVFPVKTTVYTVAPGDTLSKIASRFHVSMTAIQTLNAMKDNKVRTGMKLAIPGDAAARTESSSLITPRTKTTSRAVSTAKATAALPDETVGPTVVYLVKAGDSLSRIAVAHKTTQAAIKRANRLTKDGVWVGQKLKIPVATPTADTAAPAPSAGLGAEPVKTLTLGDAPAAPKARATTPSTKPVIGTATESVTLIDHTVRQGEDLKGIAQLYTVTEDALKKQNGLTSSTIKPGQVLKIPVAATARPE